MWDFIKNAPIILKAVKALHFFATIFVTYNFSHTRILFSDEL